MNIVFEWQKYTQNIFYESEKRIFAPICFYINNYFFVIKYSLLDFFI